MIRFLAGLWRWTRRLLLLALLVVIAASAWLMTAGVPAFVLRRAGDRLAEKGWSLTVSRARWLPPTRLALDHVRLLAADSSALVVIARQAVIALPTALDWTVPASGLWIRVRGGTVDLRPSDAAIAAGHQPLSLAGVQGEVRWDPAAGCELQVNFVTDGLLRVEGQGKILPPPRRQAAGRLPRETVPPAVDRVLAVAAQVRERLRNVSFETQPAAVCRFTIDPADAMRTHLTVDLRGGCSMVASVPIDQWRAAADWSGGALEYLRLTAARAQPPGAVLSAWLRASPGGRSFEGAAQFDGDPGAIAPALPGMGSNTAALLSVLRPLSIQASFSGQMRGPVTARGSFAAGSPDSPMATGYAVVDAYRGTNAAWSAIVRELRVAGTDAAAVLPDPAHQALERAQLRLLAPLRLDATAGPLAAGIRPRVRSGRVACDALAWRGVPFTGVSALFRMDGPRIDLLDAVARAGTGSPPAMVRAEGTLDLDRGQYTLEIDTAAPPTLAAPLLPTNLTATLESVTISGSVRGRVTLRGRLSDPASSFVAARLEADGVSRNGERADAVAVDLEYHDGILRANRMRIVRGTGLLTGRLTSDTRRKRIDLDVESSCDPVAIARMVGPGLARILEPYRFDGPVAVTVQGVLALAQTNVTDLAVTVRADQARWSRIRADRAVIALHIRDDLLTVTNLVADWCGGSVTGAVILLRPPGTNVPVCKADLTVADADLYRIAAMFGSTADPQSHKGRLFARLKFGGEAGDRFLTTMMGGGDLQLRDGYVLSIPLFGGLSRYLSVLIPGVAYAQQREFRADFRIRDRRIETANAELLGGLVTIHGVGAYAFDGTLDFRLQVLLMREGITASIVRIVTLPLSKALEFALTGTPANPHWRPLNTPTRLLRFFNKALGGEAKDGAAETRGKEPAPGATQTAPAPKSQQD